MGEVGLPELVGAVRGEAFPGGSWTFLRLCGDFAGGGENAPNRGPAEGDALADQVLLDGVRAGIQTRIGEVMAQAENPGSDRFGSAIRG